VPKNPLSPYRYWYEWRRSAKRRRGGIPFHLTPEDIEHRITFPITCPVLGIPLNDPSIPESSFSIDRVDNSQGYTVDNVRIISVRANRLKADATLEEMRAIVAYMEREGSD